MTFESGLVDALTRMIGYAPYDREQAVADVHDRHDVKDVARQIAILHDAKPPFGKRDEAIDAMLLELVPDETHRADLVYDIEQRLDSGAAKPKLDDPRREFCDHCGSAQHKSAHCIMAGGTESSVEEAYGS